MINGVSEKELLRAIGREKPLFVATLTQRTHINRISDWAALPCDRWSWLYWSRGYQRDSEA